MYCGQCGKRVLETMLFCPFCGSPIVIPDQDVAEPAPASVATEAAPVEAMEAPQEEAAETALERQGEAGAALTVESAPADDAEAAKDPLFALEPELSPAPKRADEPFEPLRFDEPAPQKAEESFEPLHLDAPTEPPRRAEGKESAEAPRRAPSLFDEADERGGGFVPLTLDAQPHGRAEAAAPEDAQEAAGPDVIPLEEPPQRRQPPRRAPESKGRRAGQTFIPVRDVDVNDMFMDSSHPEPEEEYDPYDDDDDGEEYGGRFEFEEPERGGFLQRHIRGAVGLVLLLIVIVIVFIWAATGRGQQVLATANLAWSPRAYDDLGHEAYEAGQFRQAARYFERALARESDNYEYAHSAMVAYYEAEDIESALAMLKKCIEMQPNSAEPYHEMLILYPDAATRPWEVQELLRQGYERTGDEALKPDDA